MGDDQQKRVVVSAAGADAAGLMRLAKTATLATLEAGSGHPCASLVTVALDETGEPVLLLSRLARHTTNIDADSRVRPDVECECRDRAGVLAEETV